MSATFWPGFRQILDKACSRFVGGTPPGGVASAMNVAIPTPPLRTNNASRLASVRVERSELVSLPLGDDNSTGDDSPVSVETRLSFIPAASCKPNSSPDRTPALVNYAKEKPAATVVSSLIMTKSARVGPMMDTSTTLDPGPLWHKRSRPNCRCPAQWRSRNCPPHRSWQLPATGGGR